MARPGVSRAIARLAVAALLVGSAPGGVGCAGVDAARLYNSGTDALDRGDPQSAIVDLEQAATLEPAASPIQNHLGIAYQEAGRERDALAAFERAVAIDCENEAAQANLRAARARSEHGVPEASPP